MRKPQKLRPEKDGDTRVTRSVREGVDLATAAKLSRRERQTGARGH